MGETTGWTTYPTENHRLEFLVGQVFLAEEETGLAALGIG